MSEGKLVLSDGTVFSGVSFGADSSMAGEVVFNTGMTGYPEALTDPSYKGQILCFTYPLIGNYGVPDSLKENNLDKNFESTKIHVQGLIVADYSEQHSHWNAKKSLSEWLKEQGIPAITGIDTRKLTKILREKGCMLGKIIINGVDVVTYDPNNDDLVSQVTIKEPVLYSAPATEAKKSGKNNNKTHEKESTGKRKKIVLIDCGAKHNIVHCLLKRGVDVWRVPASYDFTKEDYDGIMISNGPGDPKMNKKTIHHIKTALHGSKPIFGICLGNQLLCLAAGGNTYKLKYGHRSQNQPCIMNGTKRCYITTQNHGFAVDMKTLNGEWEEFFINANDHTNEGIRHKTKPFFSVQFHPEAKPGPVDAEFLFDEFLKQVRP